MGEIRIERGNIVEVDVDAIVNAANEGLRAGGGVCGAIFEAAGHDEMAAACRTIGHCDTGDAVITPGFALKARFVIHAVGPIWEDGKHDEETLLAGCYERAIDLAVENGCGSIAFPLISSGIFGYPKEEAWRVAIGACIKKLRKLGVCGPEVTFCVLNESSCERGNRILADMA